MYCNVLSSLYLKYVICDVCLLSVVTLINFVTPINPGIFPGDF